MDKRDLKKIAYKPSIKPTRDYYSDKDFKDIDLDDTLDERYDEGIPEKPVSPNLVNNDTIINTLDTVSHLMKFVPKEIGSNLSGMIDSMTKILEDNEIDFETIPKEDIIYEDIGPKEEGKYKPPIEEEPSKEGSSNEWIDEEPEEDIPESDNYRDDYDFILEENLPVLRLKASVVERDEDIYLNEHNLHIAQIFNKYANRMNKIMANYLTRTISMLDIDGGESLEYLLRDYNIPTKDIEDKNLKHLSDNIIKSQITNKQNILLFNRMYNKKSLQKHLRYCKMAALSKDRYFNSEFSDSGDLDGIVTNSYLSKERILSDIKYKNSFKSLHKFLNSQVEIFSKVLGHTTSQVVSKSILLDKQGIKLDSPTEQFAKRYVYLVDKELELRKNREAKLAQRQKEREEKSMVRYNN